MEDYSPVLWILLAVGGLLFNALSKRKASKEGEIPQQPNPNTPFPWLNLPQSEDTQRTGSQHDDAENSDEAYTTKRGSLDTFSGTDHSEGRYSEAEYSETEYSDEAHSLEEIPEMEYESLEVPPPTHETRHGKSSQNTLEEMLRHAEQKIAQAAQEQASGRNHPRGAQQIIDGNSLAEAVRRAEKRTTTDSHAAEQHAADGAYEEISDDAMGEAEIGGRTTHASQSVQFDLRSAVIAAEILKPKFEE